MDPLRLCLARCGRSLTFRNLELTGKLVFRALPGADVFAIMACPYLCPCLLHPAIAPQAVLAVPASLVVSPPARTAVAAPAGAVPAVVGASPGVVPVAVAAPAGAAVLAALAASSAAALHDAAAAVCVQSAAARVAFA